MTRPTVKTGLVALSLAATLGSWALLARHDTLPAPAAPQPAVQTLELPPIPTLVRPPAWSGPGGRTLDLPPIPAVSAPVVVPRPIARTRSSR